jgi:hypothetical protein
MTSNETIIKAFNKLYVSTTTKKIVGFDYVVRFEPMTNPDFIGNAYFKLYGKCDWPIYTIEILKDYIQYTFTKLYKYLGIDRSKIIGVVIETINDKPPQNTKGYHREVFESPDFKEFRKNISNYHSSELFFETLDYDINFLDNRIEPISYGGIENINCTYEVNAGEIKINGNKINFDCVTNPEVVKSDLGSMINSKIYDSWIPLPTTEETKEYLSQSEMFSNYHEFWDVWTMFVVDSTTYLNSLGGTEITDNEPKELTLTRLLNFIINANDKYQTTGIKSEY